MNNKFVAGYPGISYDEISDILKIPDGTKFRFSAGSLKDGLKKQL
jgi:hypothetical protein